MRPQREVLRKLITKYQKTESEATFEGILKRVDDIVVRKVHQLRRRFAHLKKLDFEDIYQTAISGVYDAVRTAKDCEDGNKVMARVIAYVTAAIRKMHKPPKEISGGDLVSTYIDICDEYVEDFTIQYDLIEFWKAKCSNNSLSSAEVELIHQVFYLGLTYDTISKNLGMKRGVTWLRAKEAIEKLKASMTEEDFKLFGLSAE